MIIFYYHLILCFNSDVIGEPSVPSEIEKGHSLAGLLNIQFQTKYKHYKLGFSRHTNCARKISLGHLQ